MIGEVVTKRFGTAVVCGAGLAGLSAARALIDSFDRVIIVERDELDDAVEPRAGVPQGRQVHTLLPGGRAALDEMLPGFSDDMIGLSAVRTDIAADIKQFHIDSWIPRFPSDLWSTLSSRALLESVVRRRVVGLPGVEVRTGLRAVELVANAGRVTGIKLQPRAGGQATVLSADLVLDTTGRSSNAPAWLQRLGFKAPREQVVDAHWGYAGNYYKMPDDFAPDWLTLGAPPVGSVLRGAVMQRHEGNRWMITMLGSGQDYPPHDPDGFLAFAKSIQVQDFADILAVAQPLTPISSWRQTTNRFRRYDELEHWPDGFIVMGDAVAALNPVYGQGMSVAVLAARSLQTALAEYDGDHYLAGFGHRFQRTVADGTQLPWSLAAGADYAVPGATGTEPSQEQMDLSQRWQLATILGNAMPEVTRLRYETQVLVRTKHWLYEGEIAERIEALRSESAASHAHR
jgi:2-polyprenyl-6-methoxyphenol hydroxylase-like FAD-dependent oxidoreductase